MSRPVVAIALSAAKRAEMLADRDLARLATIAVVEIEAFEGLEAQMLSTDSNHDLEQRLLELAAPADALIVAPGSPRVDAAVFDGAPQLRFVGELEGDRFYTRIDVNEAAERGITVIDTSHGSSDPVAEWGLALAILGLRDGPRLIRALHDHELVRRGHSHPGGVTNRELSGKRVGLIGFGHIAWRLVELLRPFGVDVTACDPYVPRELGAALGVTFGPLEAVFARSDVVICLAPLTPATRGLVQEHHLRSLADGSVFVNVSRGAVVDKAALEAVARDGRVVFCLDVFDPEPIPTDDPLRDLPNVLLTPHIAGVTEESRRRFFALMVDELERHFNGLESRSQTTPRMLAGRHSPPPLTIAEDHQEATR
jgi:phosphoglycerate dehydrogenase-like enzyme